MKPALPPPPAAASRPYPLGALVLGGGALLLALLLAVGFLLPADWTASAGRRVEASPVEIMEALDSPEGWRRWTTWPEGELARTGPERGAGAAISWDDPEMGSGTFTIDEVAGLGGVEYSVAFGPSMSASGRVSVSAAGGGAQVEWVEEGDLGRNPLMGYWALFMGRGQSEEMAKGLDRLAALFEG